MPHPTPTLHDDSPRPAAASPPRRHVAGDVAGFVVAMAMAWVFSWQARDLIWSLWLSSVVFGFATILSLAARGHSLASAGTSGGDARRVPLPAVIAATVFFCLHFAVFNFVHSGFLMFLFPLEGRGFDGRGPSIAAYGEVVRLYWPFILVPFLTDWRTLVHPPSAVTPLLPYRNVLRMHLLILLFGFLFFVGIENFLAYALIYAAFFVPWERLIPGLGATRAEASTGA
jgi:hypothetical protein